MVTALIEKTAQYVKLKMHHEPAGHDWFHIERVWKTAKYLQSREGGNLEMIELSVLLHDVGYHTYHEVDEEKGVLALHGMMDILEIDAELKKKIIEIVTVSKFKGNETSKPATIEAKIVQDANWLDSLGAIGIARTFAAGGYLGRAIYDPDVPVRTKLNKFIYQKKKREGTSINSFFEKALHFPKLMNTATARQIAGQKVKYVQTFLDQFMKEWQGKDDEIAQ